MVITHPRIIWISPVTAEARNESFWNTAGGVFAVFDFGKGHVLINPCLPCPHWNRWLENGKQSVSYLAFWFAHSRFERLASQPQSSKCKKLQSAGMVDTNQGRNSVRKRHEPLENELLFSTEGRQQEFGYSNCKVVSLFLTAHSSHHLGAWHYIWKCKGAISFPSFLLLEAVKLEYWTWSNSEINSRFFSPCTWLLKWLPLYLRAVTHSLVTPLCFIVKEKFTPVCQFLPTMTQL